MTIEMETKRRARRGDIDMDQVLGHTHLPSPPVPASSNYAQALEHLSELSVCKYHDPFTDIAWDAPENRIERRDPRLCIAQDHPLARTAWYAGLSAETRADFGLCWQAQTMKYGIGFEAVLSRGLLEFCQTLPDRSPEYRYAMHEVIEEARHSQMFQELIDRLDVETQPVKGFMAFIDDRVAHLGRTQPCLFFFAVLGGELFIDAENRATLRRGRSGMHPLVRQIMKIHVMEEARHVCFAQRYLEEHLSELPVWRKWYMGFIIPFIFRDAARMMLVPDARIVREFQIPRHALSEAFGPGSEHLQRLARVTQPVRRLCTRHGLMLPAHERVWRRAGLLG